MQESFLTRQHQIDLSSIIISHKWLHHSHKKEHFVIWSCCVSCWVVSGHSQDNKTTRLFVSITRGLSLLCGQRTIQRKDPDLGFLQVRLEKIDNITHKEKKNINQWMTLVKINTSLLSGGPQLSNFEPWEEKWIKKSLRFPTHSKPVLLRFLPLRQLCCGPHLFSCGERLLLQSMHWQEVSPNITGSAQKNVLRWLPQHRLSVTCDETTWALSFSVKAHSWDTVQEDEWSSLTFDSDVCCRPFCWADYNKRK